MDPIQTGTTRRRPEDDRPEAAAKTAPPKPTALPVTRWILSQGTPSGAIEYAQQVARAQALPLYLQDLSLYTDDALERELDVARRQASPSPFLDRVEQELARRKAPPMRQRPIDRRRSTESIRSRGGTTHGTTSPPTTRRISIPTRWSATSTTPTWRPGRLPKKRARRRPRGDERREDQRMKNEPLPYYQRAAVDAFERHLDENEGGYLPDAMRALVSNMSADSVAAMVACMSDRARSALTAFCRNILYREHSYWPFDPELPSKDIARESWEFLKPWVLRQTYAMQDPSELTNFGEPYFPMSNVVCMLGHFTTRGVEATLAGLHWQEWRPTLLNVAAIVEENRDVMLPIAGPLLPAWEALLAWAESERARIAALSNGSTFDRAQRAWEERQELNMWFIRETMPDVITPFLGRFDECGSVEALFARVPRGHHRPIEEHFRILARMYVHAEERGMRPESIAMIREWDWRNRPAWSSSSKGAIRENGEVATSQFHEEWFCPYLLEGGSIDRLVEKKPEFREWIIHLGLLLAAGRELALEAMRASGRSTAPYETWIAWAEREADKDAENAQPQGPSADHLPTNDST